MSDRWKLYKKCDDFRVQAPRSVQDIIEIKSIAENGIFEIGTGGVYTKCYTFSDINYATASGEEQEAMLNAWCRWLNTNSEKFKITINNRNRDMDRLENEILFSEMGDNADELRDAYNDIIMRNLREGCQGIEREMYITVRYEKFPTRLQTFGELFSGRFDLPPLFMDEPEMYILTNDICVNGATTVLDKESLAQAREMIGEDFFIMPSSIHECILVPEREAMDKSGLVQLVYEVNREVLSDTDFLSDTVYHYDGETREITMLNPPEWMKEKEVEQEQEITTEKEPDLAKEEEKESVKDQVKGKDPGEAELGKEAVKEPEQAIETPRGRGGR